MGHLPIRLALSVKWCATFLVVFFGWPSLTYSNEIKKSGLDWLETLGSRGETSSVNSPRSPDVAGVRGLDESQGKVDSMARDYKAIERLEAIVISENELEKFNKEGHLP